MLDEEGEEQSNLYTTYFWKFLGNKFKTVCVVIGQETVRGAVQSTAVYPNSALQAVHCWDICFLRVSFWLVLCQPVVSKIIAFSNFS